MCFSIPLGVSGPYSVVLILAVFQLIMSEMKKDKKIKILHKSGSFGGHSQALILADVFLKITSPGRFLTCKEGMSIGPK